MKWRLHVVMKYNGFVTFFVHLLLVAAILNLEKRLSFVTIWSIIAKFSGNIATLIRNTSVTSKNLRNHISWWRPPPSWISKNCCHFFTIWPIFTNICENIGTSIWNKSMTSEMNFEKIQDGGRRHLEFRKKRLPFLYYLTNYRQIS